MDTVSYSDCRLCPNECGVDRTNGIVGRCGQTYKIKVAWSGLHRGEEPPVSGKKGSGMVFFCGCPLHCAYCQNYQISSKNGAGIEISVDELATVFSELENFGAASLNLVTGTHYIPSIIEALEIVKKKGFNLPVVWNSSGFESVQALKMIDSYIDLYLVDVKTLDCTVASEFCGLEKYATAIVPVMQFLKRRYPKTDVNSLKGVLVRHLVFPGCIEQTMQFLTWYADNFKDCSQLSLMTQFVPPLDNPGFKKITDKEYFMLLKKLDQLGIDGFVQEMSDNEILWIPDFNRDQPFPDGFAEPLDYFLKLKKSR